MSPRIALFKHFLQQLQVAKHKRIGPQLRQRLVLLEACPAPFPQEVDGICHHEREDRPVDGAETVQHVHVEQSAAGVRVVVVVVLLLICFSSASCHGRRRNAAAAAAAWLGDGA